jgi:Glycine rich protein
VKHILSLLFLSAIIVSPKDSVAQEKVFEYTGKFQTYEVPEGVTSIEVELWGASGGFGSWENARYPDKYAPGKGGKIKALVDVEPGSKIYIFVGGRGDNATDTYQGKGGFNGGGDGNNTGEYGPYCGGGGGGASDIRVGGSGLGNRVLVAGGGGGAGSNYPEGGDHGGNGGGESALAGQANSDTGHESVGKGGSQKAGGEGGQWPSYFKGESGKLGRGGHAPDSTAGGGGGGGYFGGGAGSWSGGGGGSNYAAADAKGIEHEQGINDENGKVIIRPGCEMVEIQVEGPTTMCFGEEIVLKGKSNRNSKFTWDNGIKNGVPFKPPMGTTTYTVKSSNSKECPNTIDIKVNEGGVMVATTTEGTICEGEYTTLIVHGASGTVEWSDGVQDGVPFRPPVGVNTYKVTKEGACGGEDEITIVVNKILIKADALEETSDHLGGIEVELEGGTFPYTYKWRNESGKVIGTERDLKGVPGGNYQLEVIDVIGCTDKNTFTINVIGKYIEPDEGPKLEAEISQDEAFVTVSYPGAFEYKIENMNDETVITGHAVNDDEVEITKLPPGTYRVSLIYKQIKQYVTFVKN